MKKCPFLFLLFNSLFVFGQSVTFVAYNDCVYSPENQYKADNVTTIGIGEGSPGETSGYLLDYNTGMESNIKAIMSQSGTVVWSAIDWAGTDCATGTDAYELFGNIADMTGVISYGDPGWWVEITFSGLDPEKLYTFATSVCRDYYTDRYTLYTLRGADSCENVSSAGTTIVSETQVSFNTGGNFNEGYVARWSNIRVLDGTFTVRAAAAPGTVDEKAYAFDVFMLQEMTGNTSPVAPQLQSPPNGVTPGTTSVNLVASVFDPQGDSLDVTFWGREIPEAEDNFTIVVLPDTQFYSDFYPAIFTVQTQWIKDNKDVLNLVFVSHEGDIVNYYENETQWQNAKTSMSILDGIIPYGLAPGNHDEPADLYNIYFPYTDYEGVYPWYGGHYPADKNDNNYQLFSAGGLDFLMIHLEFFPGFDVLTWADSVLKAYPDRIAILTTHSYLDYFGERCNLHVMESSEYIWLNLIETNPNVRFVLCGHVHNEQLKIDPVQGHPVYQILADYQSDDMGGNGWLRLMEFSPRDNKVYVKTYSPYLNQYRTGNASEFDLDFTMNDYSEIQTVSNVSSGSSVSAPWSGLNPDGDYEWYVSVNDGELTKESVKWQIGSTGGLDLIPVPGTIYGEDFKSGGEGIGYHDTTPGNSGNVPGYGDVDVQETEGEPGEYNIGWIDPGEWLAYDISVAQSGLYTLTARVASNYTSDESFHVEINGVDITDSITFNTDAAGYFAWIEVVRRGISLQAGIAELKICMETTHFNLDSIRLDYNGAGPFPIPGKIEAENYNFGGEGIGYHDIAPHNSTGLFRPDDVFIEPCADIGKGYNVGWIHAGEWLAYEVDVTQSGYYRILSRVSTGYGTSSTFHIESNNVDITGPCVFQNTGGWQNWINVSANPIYLEEGIRELKIVMDSNYFNINYIEISSEAGGGGFTGGRLEAEDYNEGGEGIGYHDIAPHNSTGLYRTDDVFIETTIDAGGGYNVGWILAGEWLSYTIEINESGQYRLDARMASAASGNLGFHFELNNEVLGAQLVFQGTGDWSSSGWQAWQDVGMTAYIEEGIYNLKFVADSNYMNFNYLELNPVSVQ